MTGLLVARVAARIRASGLPWEMSREVSRKVAWKLIGKGLEWGDE
jgi:hypothetical protein